MQNTITCRACGKLNRYDVSRCEYCGTPFLPLLPSNTTKYIKAPPLATSVPDRVIQLTQLYNDIMIFQVMGYEQPILAKATSGKVTLGRYNPGEIPPTVDLTPYNGSLMGVSRQHAVVNRTSDGYALTDLGSTNGTWLNDTRLNAQKAYPMHSGDMLRLGQVALHVYFRQPESQPAVEIVLSLKHEFAEVPLQLSIDGIETELVPFLKATQELQAICNQMLNVLQSSVVITNITVDPTKSLINVKMTGIIQALRILRGNIARWREFQRERLQILYEREHIKAAQSFIQSSANNGNGDTGQLRIETWTTGLNLAYEIVKETAPDLDEAQRRRYVDDLLPHLQKLALSPLRVTLDS
jgi:hypothetical protein